MLVATLHYVNSIDAVWFAGITLCAWCVLRAIPRFVAGPNASKPNQVRRLPDVNAVKTQSQSSVVGQFDHWFHRAVALTQSNFTTTEATWLIVATAFVVAVATFVFTEQPGATVIAALLTLVVGVLGFAVARRLAVKKFQSQLPHAMQLMARAVRAGESLEQAVNLVADAADDPLQKEFRRCLRHVEMGLPVSEAMGSLADRMDTLDTRIFGSTISVHRESGGSLANTLDRLAEVIRKRFEYHQKLRSTTGAGRVSVIIIALLGLLIFSYMFVFRPDYGKEMWTDPTGQTMLICAVISELVGLMWVYSLLRAQY